MQSLVLLLVLFVVVAMGEKLAGTDKKEIVAKVQGQAPPFVADAVVGGEIKKLSLDDYRGKYLVLFFYPLDFTFVCPTEIIAFNDRAAEFRAINTEIVAVSVDSPYTHLAWTRTARKDGGLGEISIPLVSDITKSIARDYNVLIDSEGITLRGLFIINPEGVIRQMTVNDLPVGRSVDEVLRLVNAFQHTDKHGEVCPANWKQGDKTMVPDPEKSKEYFRAVDEL